MLMPCGRLTTARMLVTGLAVDCFAGDNFPSAFCEPRTWGSMRGRLAPDGVLLVNLGGVPDNGRIPPDYASLLAGLVSTFGPDRLHVHTATGNLVVLAAQQELDWAAVGRRLPPALGHLAGTVWQSYHDYAAQVL